MIANFATQGSIPGWLVDLFLCLALALIVALAFPFDRMECRDPVLPAHVCPGCHAGDFADFDHYCDVNQITEEETPMAFAAWLHLASGGEWDGTAERIL